MNEVRKQMLSCFDQSKVEHLEFDIVHHIHDKIANVVLAKKLGSEWANNKLSRLNGLDKLDSLIEANSFLDSSGQQHLAELLDCEAADLRFVCEFIYNKV